MTIARRIALILAPWAVIVLVWYAIHYSGIVDPALVPTPHAAAERFFELAAQRLPKDVWISTQREPPILARSLEAINEAARAQGFGKLDTAVMWKCYRTLWQPSTADE